MNANVETSTIRITLTHGDLRYARYPLAVGHYYRDVIVSAEAALNAALDNVLRHRFDLGRYPGPIGTHAIVRQSGRPKGAIVIGLGDVGELTPERLRQTVSVALKEYALAIANDSQVPVTDGGFRSAAFSTLLVGTDGGSSGTLADSVYAILRAAIDTNRGLAEAKLFGTVRVDAIEFIELYEDTATRAAHVIADLPGVLKRELKIGEALKGEPCAGSVPGGRYFRPATPYEAGWWQRIAVRERAAGGEQNQSAADTATQLKFTVLSDRARLEQDTATAQRALVEELITSTTGETNVNHELSTALYHLLVPAPVRDRISQGENVLFMVDRVGAAFPFELMAARGNDNHLHPLIEAHGMLRQFETEQYDARPAMAHTKRVLVVGNPKTAKWPDLPGAAKEAASVAKIARAHGLDVTYAGGPPADPSETSDDDQPSITDPQQVVARLITGEFQFLHFAAHGQYNADPMKSGVIISDRLFITPAEVAALPLVPELVFLNCCYLGTMKAAPASSPEPRLASSLAEGFIRAGARAVIAAGWAVDDDAGLLFAEEFYQRFFRGESFGDAIKQARAQTMSTYPDRNTWGAYQCYGNPDFRFSGGAAAGSSYPISYVTRSEALQALRTLASNARAMRMTDARSLAEQFGSAWKAIPGQWRDGEMLAAAGEIAGELGQFDEAIDYYRQALKSPRASAPIYAVEQLANLLSRNAATKALRRKPDASTRKAFDEAEKWLKWLERLPSTPERRSVYGSLYKRMATVLPEKRREYLMKARECYGVKIAPATEYRSLNALAFAFVLADAASRRPLGSQAESFWKNVGQAPPNADRSFWDVVGVPDTLLHRQIILGAMDDAAITDLRHRYDDAFEAQPSRREWASVTDHVWFLYVMTGDRSLPCYNRVSSAALLKLHRHMTRRKR